MTCQASAPEFTGSVLSMFFQMNGCEAAVSQFGAQERDHPFSGPAMRYVSRPATGGRGGKARVSRQPRRQHQRTVDGQVIGWINPKARGSYTANTNGRVSAINGITGHSMLDVQNHIIRIVQPDHVILVIPVSTLP
jgi:gentisate 1,2-dioxygenase